MANEITLKKAMLGKIRKTGYVVKQEFTTLRYSEYGEIHVRDRQPSRGLPEGGDQERKVSSAYFSCNLSTQLFVLSLLFLLFIKFDSCDYC